MEIKNILLVCSSGMSASMMMKALQNAADREKFDARVKFAGIACVEDKLNDADAILIGPQIRHRYDAVKKIADKAGKPVEMIPAGIYGLMDGKALLQIVKKMTGSPSMC